MFHFAIVLYGLLLLFLVGRTAMHRQSISTGCAFMFLGSVLVLAVATAAQRWLDALTMGGVAAAFFWAWHMSLRVEAYVVSLIKGVRPPS